MINKIKYNYFSTALIQLAFRLFCRRVKGFIFVASTGRSGTNTLQLFGTAAKKVYSCHEGHPIMNGDTMIKFNNDDEQLMIEEFNSRKLLRILWHSMGNHYYIETNHMFIKCFYSTAAFIFGERLKVISITRDPSDVALSMYGRADIPGTEEGNKWYLDPKASRTLVKLGDFLYGDTKFSHDYFKCLWYCYEIKARIIMFKKNYPKVPVVDIQTSELNNMDAVGNLFNKLNIVYDEAKLRSLIGMRANSTPLSKKAKLNIDTGLLEEFSELCELKVKEILES